MTAENKMHGRKREPILRVSKRDLSASSGFKGFLRYILAIAAAIVAGGIFILAIGVNPITFYKTIVKGCFKSEMAMLGLVRIIMPLLIISLGTAIAFKMKFWNIGAEGQFIMGAVGATLVALNCDGMPHWLTMVLMAVSGMAFGGLFGLIPAFFKSKFGTSETLLTLMLNYIALYTVQWLRDGPWRDPAASGFPKIAKFPKTAWVDKLFKMDVTWIVALALVVIVYIYLNYTKHGYEISVVGDSVQTARYAGMNVGGITMRTMLISSAIIGLAGMLQVGGEATSHTLTTGIASGVGFTAIIVAWLARLNPVGILFVSSMFGILEKGCGVAESTFNISSSVSDILQGIILFVVLGADFFIRYKVHINLLKRNKIAGGQAAAGSVTSAEETAQAESPAQAETSRDAVSDRDCDACGNAAEENEKKEADAE